MSQREYWNHPTGRRSRADSPAATACFGYLVEQLSQAADLSPDARILDVGTGHGPLMFHLLKRYPNVTGVDFSKTMLDRNPCKGRLVCGDVTDLPFDDNAFDVVVCSAMLHHLSPSEQELALCEMCRVSRRTVAVSEPNRLNPAMFAFSLIKKEERGVLALGRRRLRVLFARANLHVTLVRIHTMVLPNVSPEWYIPIGKALGRIGLERLLGFSILVVGRKKAMRVTETT